ncbi:MAG: TetR/AcrR family transcriptional regulator [Deltaproteobacteria bacterium]|jgi:AcrR family transcriptional regulator|nr:TetR/AcrR family transcriptional regulator [Deltaproteobacteria bacterium]
MTLLGKKGAATRRAVLESARLAFTQSGCDAGVREIAEKAGVTAMLVNRYFGSKENLFSEAVEMTLSAPGIITQEVLRKSPKAEILCHDISSALVEMTAPNVTPLDGFLIMLRSAGSKRAIGILREKFETHFSQPLAELLPEKNRQERSALFLAVIAGFQLMRQIIELPALTEAEPNDLTKFLEALFLVLADEKPEGSSKTPLAGSNYT